MSPAIARPENGLTLCSVVTYNTKIKRPCRRCRKIKTKGMAKIRLKSKMRRNKMKMTRILKVTPMTAMKTATVTIMTVAPMVARVNVTCCGGIKIGRRYSLKILPRWINHPLSKMTIAKKSLLHWLIMNLKILKAHLEHPYCKIKVQILGIHLLIFSDQPSIE